MKFSEIYGANNRLNKREREFKQMPTDSLSFSSNRKIQNMKLTHHQISFNISENNATAFR